MQRSKAIEFFINKIRFTASTTELELINSYTEDMDEELVIEAMKIAIKNDKAHTRYAIRYIKAILDNLLNENITTFEQYKNIKGGGQNAKNRCDDRKLKKSYGKKI